MFLGRLQPNASQTYASKLCAGVYKKITEGRKELAQYLAKAQKGDAVSQFRMPRLGGLFRRRGLSEEFDMHNLDPQTHDRLDAVLPGFFKKEDN